MNSQISNLQKRINYASSFIKEPIFFAENVPQRTLSELQPLSIELSGLLTYPPSQGKINLLESIAKREHDIYKIPINPDNLLITNGALHGLNLILQQNSEFKNLAFCQAPVFSGVANSLINNGFKIKYFNKAEELFSDEQNHFEFKRMGVLYLNVPCNPTGEIIDPKTVQTIVELSQKLNFKVIFDLVYDSYLFEENKVLHPFAMMSSWDNVYILNSLSKNYGLPGLRIGWILSSPKNITKLTYLLEQQCISVCDTAQFYAAAAINTGNTFLQNRVLQGKECIQTLWKSYFPQIKLNRIQGGTQFFPEMPNIDIEPFADFLLYHYGLVVATSSNYSGIEGSYLRIPLGYSQEIIQNSMKIISLGLNHWITERCKYACA